MTEAGLLGVASVYAVGVLFLLVWGVVVALRFKDTLREVPLPADPPMVSVIVPARNEGRNIDRCARGLIGQDYPHLELVFVDDDSTDATPDILARHTERDPRIRVTRTGSRPEGWNGKQWACHSGVLISTGDWLCFMDADTYAEPTLLRQAVAFALDRKVDMLTLQPWFELGGLWERIVLPIGLWGLLLVFPPHRVNDPDNGLAVANGQFILMPRAVYEAVGGHEAIRDRMMDDFSLAELVKGGGYRLYMADGTQVMRVRLYTNLREIRAGALKAAVEISGGWLATYVAMILNLLVNVLPVAWLAWAVWTGEYIVAAILGVSVAALLAFYAALRVFAFRAPPWAAVSYPLGGLVVTGIILDGMFHLVSGRGVTWKGRSLLGTPTPPRTRVFQRLRCRVFGDWAGWERSD